MTKEFPSGSLVEYDSTTLENTKYRRDPYKRYDRIKGAVTSFSSSPVLSNPSLQQLKQLFKGE